MGLGVDALPEKKNILRGDITVLDYFLYEKLLSTRVSPLVVDEQMSVGLHFFVFRVFFMSCLILTLKTQQTEDTRPLGPLVDLLEDVAPNQSDLSRDDTTSVPVASLDFVIFHSRKMLISSILSQVTLVWMEIWRLSSRRLQS